MKTETKIAEENIKLDDGLVCVKHEEACKRFLEYFKKINIRNTELGECVILINDLQNAIKKYNEAGI